MFPVILAAVALQLEGQSESKHFPSASNVLFRISGQFPTDILSDFNLFFDSEYTGRVNI